MGLLSPKDPKMAGRGHSSHLAHSPYAGHLPASPVINFKAALFLVGLGIVSLISIFVIGGSTPFEPPIPSSRAACGGKHVGPGTQSLYHEKRSEVYDQMDAEFAEKGAEFLFGGSTSQTFKISDLFVLKKGEVKPVLKAAIPPVRANVLRMSPVDAADIARMVRERLEHHFPEGVWFQDPDLYHMSLFHASHHLSPVPKLPKKVKEEAKAVRSIAMKACPLRISLDRVVLTTTGVVLGCWQVLDGTDPAEIRDELREALPTAPARQLYNRVMLHTSFARILAPPIWPDGSIAHSAEAAMPILRSIVYELNQELCRTETTVEELWYVEEHDVLALALNGKITAHKFNMSCIQPDWTGTI